MGSDVSTLFVPRALERPLLRELTDSVFKDGPENLVALIVDEMTGPVALRASFPSYSSVSLWSDDPVAWDRYARALSKRLTGERLIAIVMADHASVGGWQVLQDGKATAGAWAEQGYTTVSLAGFEAAYGLRPSPQGEEATFWAEGLTTSARRGVCLRSPGGGLRAGQALDAEQTEAVLTGGSDEWSCCMLELPGARKAEPAPPPSPPPKVVAAEAPATPEDVELAEALGKLQGLTPVKRMTIEMIRKQALSWGKALTERQRREARELLGR
jgi:hypothetical protein